MTALFPIFSPKIKLHFLENYIQVGTQLEQLKYLCYIKYFVPGEKLRCGGLQYKICTWNEVVHHLIPSCFCFHTLSSHLFPAFIYFPRFCTEWKWKHFVHFCSYSKNLWQGGEVVPLPLPLQPANNSHYKR